MKTDIKGKFTFRTAAVFFILSALFELFSITSQVPLFGDVRGGMVAATYHLIYIVLYLFLGVGLYRAKPWSYTLVFLATGLYTLDRMVYVLDRQALKFYLTAILDKYEITVGVPEMEIILKAILIASGLIVACWWGFAGYTYLRREYFHQPAGSKEGVETDRVL